MNLKLGTFCFIQTLFLHFFTVIHCKHFRYLSLSTCKTLNIHWALIEAQYRQVISFTNHYRNPTRLVFKLHELACSGLLISRFANKLLVHPEVKQGQNCLDLICTASSVYRETRFSWRKNKHLFVSSCDEYTSYNIIRKFC